MMSSVALFVVAPALFMVGLIVFALRRGLQMKQLAADGVEATGTVTRKLKFSGGATATQRTYRVLYTYTDEYGRNYKAKTGVSKDVFDSLQEGGPIAIMYSRSKPGVSGPTYQVEQARQALKRNDTRDVARS
ncbi:MAG TPA: DUF3592 domain-containing protein [Vicinamibacterales bacterium]|nr:DUF3592 domain-containing protein [Vicinamibacterales bacterium]